MDQDDLASLSISEIAQQLATLAATLRDLAEIPVFDEPANDDAERENGQLPAATVEAAT